MSQKSNDNAAVQSSALFEIMQYDVHRILTVQYLKLIGTVPAIDINAYLGTVGEKNDMKL